jgi:hypothetical protein
MPRTIRSIFTPAMAGVIQRLDDLRLDQRVQLRNDCVPACLAVPVAISRLVFSSSARAA